MSENKWTVDIDLSDVVAWLVFFGLVVLSAGEPDLLDAIIAWVGRQP